MAGFETVLASAVINAAFDAKAASQQKKALRQRHALEQKQLVLARDVEARKRRDQLKSDQATQRARFGALGVTATGGSAGAVMRGLSTAAWRDENDTNSAFDLNSLGMAQGFANQQRRNLLELRRKQFNTLRSVASKLPR
jgi:hypothetical protein